MKPTADPSAVEVTEVARSMAAAGLVVGTVGNVSARVTGGFVITPSRTEYGSLSPELLVWLTSAGDEFRSPATPSREWPLHAAIYRARPDVRAIVHTHSVYATAWSFLDEPLGPPVEELEYYAIGEVRTSDPAPSGSDQLAHNAITALGESAAVLLGRHGVVAVGASAHAALTVALATEHQAHVAWLLRGQLPPTRRTPPDAEAINPSCLPRNGRSLSR